MDLIAIKTFAKAVLEDDTTGHDWQHALRVEKNARKIWPDDLSEAETEVVLAACWLHDTIDAKISAAKRQTAADIKKILEENGAAPFQTDEILYIIQNLSYSKNLGTKRELSLLGQIVQDADRLDAIGAIGVARAFYFGGHSGSPLYDAEKPRRQDELTEKNYRADTSVINHFYEKLLLLEETMNTEAGKREAAVRTHFMKGFLERFYQEISDA